MIDPAIEPVPFATMMALESHGPDTFVGVGPRYPWGGLYGGQIVAQALRAATLSVDEGFVPHSLHAYFIRRGDAREPIRFEVDRLRNGRSFCTRRVVARQAAGAILSLDASFQQWEDGPEASRAVMPSVPDPLDSQNSTWSHVFERRFVVDEAHGGNGIAQAWLRMTEPVAADPSLQACALAYLSDDIPTDAVVMLHPDRPTDGTPWDQVMMSASLDHSIWFHRPFDIGDWHLYDLRCSAITSSRGVAAGHVFAQDGTHLATINQEVLLRNLR